MSYLWDDEAGYDRDDPKHPSFAEQWLDYVDEQRKREKEDGPDEPTKPDPEDAARD